MQQERYKRCRKCGKLKPPSEFWRSPRGAGGYYARCKVCMSAGRRASRRRYYLRNRERILARRRRPIAARRPVADIPDSVGHWLAGFLDGEGSFQITRQTHNERPDRPATYTCALHVVLRDDDRAVLERIAGEVDRGTVTGPYTVREGTAACRWAVHSKEGCAALVELLDRCPLWSKKAADYGIWREAVLLWQGTRQGFAIERDGSNADTWTQLGVLKGRLEAGRRRLSSP